MESKKENGLTKIYKPIKEWIKANGITGFGGLLGGLLLLFSGYNLLAGIGFGIFATRNWDIFANWVASFINKKENDNTF